MKKVKTSKSAPKDIQTYIKRFPKEVQALLQLMRSTIQKTAPHASETISYAMPAFKMQRTLVWFAGYKKHIGFYPGNVAISTFKKEISVYKNSKGAVQFPLDEPLPIGLIKRIVKYRIKADSA